MFLDRYDVQADGRTLDATAQYCTTGGSSSRTRPRTDRRRGQVLAGKETVQVDIPVIVQQIITQALPPQVQGGRPSRSILTALTCTPSTSPASASCGRSC